MTDEIGNKLAALTDIAQLKSDRAVSALASAKRALDETQLKIKALDQEVRETLTASEDPHSMHLAIKFSELKRQHRAELLAELARREIQRKAALKVAQADEGRRIALQKLRDQAS